jgi:hypothetical protein
MAVTSSLPARPNLGDDPVIPHNGYQTLEEGEKAFTHLLKKAGVDATWTWDQTMRAIITDPLYKALNTLAEKKATWQKVFSIYQLSAYLLNHDFIVVRGPIEGKRAGRKRRSSGKTPTCDS